MLKLIVFLMIFLVTTVHCQKYAIPPSLFISQNHHLLNYLTWEDVTSNSWSTDLKNPVKSGELSNYAPMFICRCTNCGNPEYPKQAFPGYLNTTDGLCHTALNYDRTHSTFHVLTNPARIPLTWVQASRGDVPKNSFIGGYDAWSRDWYGTTPGGDHGSALYVGRADMNGLKLAGKVHVMDKGIYFPYKGKEFFWADYEVLTLPVNFSN